MSPPTLRSIWSRERACEADRVPWLEPHPDRLLHCGGVPDTGDYTPPKMLINRPCSDEMIVVPSCYEFTNAASLDESRLACVVECVVTGEVEADHVCRTAVVKMLDQRLALAVLMAAIRSAAPGRNDVQLGHRAGQADRTKIARVHAAYELQDAVASTS